jgi:glycosyltransferase involved in cell wall biosynthesis
MGGPLPVLSVGLNGHLLSGAASYRSAGVHQYILHLLRHLPEAGCRVTAFLGPSSPVEAGWEVRRSRLPTHRPLARILWEQAFQPAALRQTGVDLAHGPAFVAPLAAPCPTVVTVHDLSFLRFPHLFRPANRLYLRLFTRASVRRARQVIAVSAHAADETVRLLGADPHKVHVVYHGVDPLFRPLPPDEVAAWREARGLPERLMLAVGTLEPRKNLPRLIEAFANLRRPDLTLALVGGRGWYEQEIFTCVERLGVKGQVIFPGYVANEELLWWYNAATVFAYPSLYEGFGLPVLEAQACGTPVLTADSSALPEAAGDGALLVDPYRVEAIAEGLRRLLDDEGLREQMRQRGLAHAARFNWQHAAAETVAVYHQALSEDRGA